VPPAVVPSEMTDMVILARLVAEHDEGRTRS